MRYTTAIICFISLIYFNSKALAVEQYKFEKLWPTLQQPWFFFDPVDIAVDGNGNSYLADKTHHRIQKFTTDGKFITSWGTEGSGNGQFSYPSGIAAGADGLIYVADTGNHRIQKFSENGVFLTAWGTYGTGNGQFATPYSIAADAQGNICIADKDNHRIQKFNNNGIYITSWGTEGTGNGQLNYPSGIAVDADGFIYVADTGNHRIQKFTANGSFVLTWGSYGTANGEFNSPCGIECDAKGFVYIADRQNHRIQRFNINGTYDSQWGSFGAQQGYFNTPNGIASDANGYLYVADTGNQRIQKFTTSGTFTAKWGSAGTEAGFFKLPYGIAIDDAGNIYISEHDNHRIQKLNTQGISVALWGHNAGDGSSGSGDGEFYHPAGVAIGPQPQQYIYVVDMYNNRVQRLTPYGVPVPWGTVDINTTGFSYPYGAATNAAGIIYITDYFNDRVLKFSPDGALLTAWGNTGTGDGQFISPAGIVVSSDGYIYVADNWNNRIQKFTPDGGFVAKWGKNSGDGSSGTGDGEFSSPSGLAIDTDGFVYVADTGNDRIQKFTADGAFVATWGSFGNSPGQFSHPEAVAVGSDGSVYVTDKGNNRIQMFRKMTVLENAKAIIVAGGGDYPGNNLWNATQMCANFSYWSLLHQGFSKQDIYYLSSDTDLDLDGNGVLDDVDDAATQSAFANAIAQCSAEGTNDVIIYLTDHGGNGLFRLNSGELLSVSELAILLEALQSSISGKTIVIYDACESGSFVPLLAGDNRIIITSTAAGEKAKFLDNGLISFSNFFWTAVFNGSSIAQAFNSASDSMSFIFDNQHPQLSGAADNLYIGNGTPVFGQAPVIGEVSAPQTIQESTAATLYAAGLSDADGIARVWAVIWPPDYINSLTDNPVLALPAVDLLPAGENRYEALYSDFSMTGIYRIAIYAMDRLGNTSVPSFTTVTVDSPLDRKAIIVATADLTDPAWPAIQRSAVHACEALLLQGYQKQNIKLFSPVTFSACVDFTYSPTLSNLYYYLTAWAAVNAQDVVVYLLGSGSLGSLRLSNTETLSAETLDAWLDQLQNSTGLRVILIYDANYSGSFLPELKPPVGSQRIVISSAGENEAAYFSANGDVSFSLFFCSQVLNGATVYNAFAYAKNAISFLNEQNVVSFSCYRQTPMLDDNGNGLGNEQVDGALARTCRIGTGIVLADDAPTIATAGTEETILNGETATLIWAQAVIGTHPIVRVWAVITPPSFCPGQPGGATGALPIVELATYNSTQNRYEGTYDGFYANTSGSYTITIYAMDAEGNISTSKNTSVYQAAGPDIYEVDDTYLQANLIAVIYSPAQRHNFHESPDPDWVTFYGLAGETYTIEAGNLGGLCNPVLELYAGDGITLLGYGWNKIDNRVYFDWLCQDEGIYFVRAWNLSGAMGKDTEYDLRVYKPEAPLLGTIAGSVINSKTRALLTGVKIRTNGNQTALSQQGEYLIAHPEGTYTMTAEATGYRLFTDNVSVSEGEIVIKNISMVPITTSTSTIPTTISSSSTTSGATTTSTTTPPSCQITSVSPSQAHIGFGLLPRIRRITVTASTDLDGRGEELAFDGQSGIRILGVPKVIGNTIKASVLFWGVKPGVYNLSLGNCGSIPFTVKRF